MCSTVIDEPDENRNRNGEATLDPSGIPPMWDESIFAEALAEMVADEAPRFFAVVAEFGTRVNAWCVAWGMAFGHKAHIIRMRGNQYQHYAVTKPEDALRYFRAGANFTHHIVWADPSLATNSDTADTDPETAE